MSIIGSANVVEELEEVDLDFHKYDYRSGHPAVFCSTYHKYNEGRPLAGMWLDLYTFSSYEDFIATCRWLHRDEEDSEFAYLDFENYPSEWYSKSCMYDETFERIFCFMPAKFRKISHKPHGLTGINSLPDALPCNLKKKTIKVNNPLNACRSGVFPVFSHPNTEDN